MTPRADARWLVLCADDYAVHAPASRGIVALARQGRLSATSAMVLSPRWAEDAAPLRELRGRIDVGLHLDWTSEFARAAGHGLALAAAMRRAVFGGFDPVAARTVIERQLDASEAHWQAVPDHVDGHQHVQQFDGLRQALIEVLARRYGHATPPYLRCSRVSAVAGGMGERLKAQVITALGATALARAATRQGLPCAPALAGVYDFQGDAARFGQLMGHWLSQAPAGAIVMCHPADAMEPGDAIGAARVREAAWLGSAGFAEQLRGVQVLLRRGRYSVNLP